MKKSIAIVLVLMLGVSLFAGCGGGGGNSGETPGNDTSSSDPETDAPVSDRGDSADDGGASFGIDFTSTEVQPMSEQRATREKLEKTVNEWLEGATMFPEGTEMSKRTYKDFVDYIGCDATEYKFDDSYNARCYFWKAGDSNSGQLGVWFKEIGGIWRLSFSGSSNLI